MISVFETTIKLENDIYYVELPETLIQDMKWQENDEIEIKREENSLILTREL